MPHIEIISIDEWLNILAIWFVVMSVAVFLALIFSCLYWFWREPSRPTKKVFAEWSPREYCPKCGSREIELLYGADDDYECYHCGLIWYV